MKKERRKGKKLEKQVSGCFWFQWCSGINWCDVLRCVCCPSKQTKNKMEKFSPDLCHCLVYDNCWIENEMMLGVNACKLGEFGHASASLTTGYSTPLPSVELVSTAEGGGV